MTSKVDFAGRTRRTLAVAALAGFATATMAQEPLLPKDDPFQFDFYGKLQSFKTPDGRQGVPPVKIGHLGIEVGLGYLDERLRELRKARDDLLDMCLGPHADKQVIDYRGHKVIGNPQWLRDCIRRASFLTTGVGGLDEALRKWNAMAGTNYVQPRMPAADLQAWAQKEASFLNFNGSACDDATHDIVVRVPLGQADHAQVYARNKLVCGAQWAELFEPAEVTEARRKRQAKARLHCRPGTTYMETDAKPPTGLRETCDEADRTVDPGKAVKGAEPGASPGDAGGSGHAGGSGAGQDLQAALGDIEAGGYRTKAMAPDRATQAMLRSAQDSGAGFTSSVSHGLGQAGVGAREAARQAGELAESMAQIEQVQSGIKSAGMADDPGQPGVPAATKGCDEAAERAALQQYIKGIESRAAGMTIEPAQCFRARGWLQLARRQLAFVQRCGGNDAVPLRSEVQRIEREERELCAIAQAPRAAAGQTVRRPPTAQGGAGSKTRPSAPKAPCDRCLPDR